MHLSSQNKALEYHWFHLPNFKYCYKTIENMKATKNLKIQDEAQT